MDFRFTQEQDEAAELAAGILQDRATNARLKSVEAEERHKSAEKVVKIRQARFERIEMIPFSGISRI